MRWGKFVLVFQAVVTFIIGGFLLFQVLNIQGFQEKKIQELTQSFKGDVNLEQFPQFKEIDNLKIRYKIASPILLFFALIEVVIIVRLVD